MTLICGVDEAGRGPLCGPVFASAVILDDNLKIKNLGDSKKISPKKRKEIYEEIKINAFEYTFAAASVEEIDKLIRLHKEKYFNHTLIWSLLNFQIYIRRFNL